MFERQRPGKGFRHVLRKSDIERFIALLPDWDELSRGLDGIVLLPGDPEYEGICFETWVGVFAWDRDLWHYYDRSYLDLKSKRCYPWFGRGRLSFQTLRGCLQEELGGSWHTFLCRTRVRRKYGKLDTRVNVPCTRGVHVVRVEAFGAFITTHGAYSHVYAHSKSRRVVC